MALLDLEVGSVFHVPMWKGYGRKLKSKFTLLGREKSRGSRSKRPEERPLCFIFMAYEDGCNP